MSECQVEVLIECSISPGKVDEFKRRAQGTVDAPRVRSDVTGYRWYFSRDQTKCYIIEQHPDTISAVRHLDVIGVKILDLLDVSRITRFEIFGPPGHLESAKVLLGNLARTLQLTKGNPRVLDYWNGFAH